MRIALFPGSFDPVTNGHLDIIKRGSSLFDYLYVVVSNNRKKNYLFTEEERLSLIKENIISLKNVEVVSSSLLTVEEAVNRKAKYILRGFRNYLDILDEIECEKNNKFLNNSIETVYLSSRTENETIRSSSIKEFLHYGVDVSTMVPRNVLKALKNKNI